MNGYELLMNKTNKERAYFLGVSEKKAEEIKTMTMEELRRCEHICLEEMKDEKLCGNCRYDLACCYECRKEFLENEI